MASLRDRIIEAVVGELVAAGIDAEQRGARTEGDTAEIVIVAERDEGKRIELDQYYSCDLNIICEVVVPIEGADPSTHGGNPYRYLDEQMTAVETALAAMGVAQTLQNTIPGAQDAQLRGTVKLPPTSENEIVGHVLLLVEYRHDVSDPSSYTLTF